MEIQQLMEHRTVTRFHCALCSCKEIIVCKRKQCAGIFIKCFLFVPKIRSAQTEQRVSVVKQRCGCRNRVGLIIYQHTKVSIVAVCIADDCIRKKIAEQHHVSESYVSRSEKFMKGVEIMEELVPGMQEKILSGQTKIRDADLHRLAKADYIDRQKIVDEILYPERKVEPKPNTNGAPPEPGKAPYMPMQKIESVYDSDAYPKEVRYEYVALEHITTRFRTEFDYQLKMMPDNA